ncbi:hypothetical protein P22_0235 [Propionispora sp. 2/2-37]|uniref:DNA primase n=1 Tax=Propionispora sp. 2/2-37 TaxID=1677858 RepID=UPI0006BB546E|nr:DNA primase [Propionispora sp. 2/2-37]CUH94173.1 hypothetical protein P22_0235 [Propionispora sp. 2/2-37]
MKDREYGEFVERLRSESDIVSIISGYVSLHKKGKNFWGCCPFHNEKTPSFSVAPEKGFFYCFGCQTGGNIFSFLMKIENIGFSDAVKLLAGKLNIPLPEREKTEQERYLEREQDRLFHAHELASAFFYSCLTKTNLAHTAREYLTRRGISDESIALFKLGFAPPSWDRLVSALTKRDISADIMIKSGLAVAKNAGGSMYDRFRNRIMFPICDLRGRVVGFGGRVIDESHPKYLNSPETPIFNKRHILFGLNIAEKYIKATGQAVVVEGYLDAITAHAAGIQNTVASLGTAFTLEQAKALRSAREIVFAYDSDGAGQKATARALEIARRQGVTIKIVDIPDGKDPDEYIKKHGADAFKLLITNSLSVVDYHLQTALRATDFSTLEGKVAVVNKMIPILAALDNEVEINGYITQIADSLSIDEASVRSELRKFLIFNKKDKIVKMGKDITAIHLRDNHITALAQAEKNLIRFMCEDRSIIPYVQVQLRLEDVRDELRKKIMKLIFNAYNMEKNIADVNFLEALGAEADNELSHIMLMDIDLNNVAQMVDDCLKTIRLTSLKDLYEQHRLRADELQRMGDSSFLQELAESQRINDEISKLHQS